MSSINEKIGICVIGSGRAGMIHARNFARALPKAKLVAMVDPIEDTVRHACVELELETSYTDYRDALSDPNVDAVIVVTPTVLHREIVVAAAQCGKHVFCEKPMAMNVEECDEMIRACTDNKVKLQIGFMRRFDQGFMTAKKRIDNGEIGEVVLVRSCTRGPSIPQPWQYDIAASNGPLAEVNSHDIDTLRWFAESEISEVYCIAGNYRCPQAKAEHPDFYDNVIMSARFANGLQGQIDGAVSVRYGYDAKVEVLGTNGVLHIGRLDQSGVVVVNSDSGITTPAVESWRNLFLDAYLQEDREFIDCIIENSAPRVTGHDGKMAVAVVNAGNRSILEKRPVQLEVE
jgi:myo-inositol 2-dehydrogenase/D-chiro-inositol 1-dehydrogenase/scyllo-inositol 2-dehydrogenase (NAD+)